MRPLQPDQITMIDMFARPVFVIRRFDNAGTSPILFDAMNWDEFMCWAPRLGPSSMLLYVALLRVPAATPTEPFIVNPFELARTIGLKEQQQAERAWYRLHIMHILRLDEEGVFVFPRYLPRIPHGDVERRDEPWQVWYRQMEEWVQSGVTR